MEDRPRQSSSYPQRSSSKFPNITYQQNPQRSLSLLSPAESIIEILSGALVKTSAKYLFPQSNSPQSNLSNKFTPQRSHLLLPVYSCNHHPQRKQRALLFNVSPGFNSPAGRQGFIFLDENTFINISHFIHLAYIHDKVHTTLSHFEHHDIMHVIHHDIAYN